MLQRSCPLLLRRFATTALQRQAPRLPLQLLRNYSAETFRFVPVVRRDNMETTKRKYPERSGGRHKKQRKVKPKKEGGADETLEMDVRLLLESQPATTPAAAEATVDSTAEPTAPAATPELPLPFTTIELEILELSSGGDGLGLHDGRAYVVPFTLPGDRVSAKIIRHTDTHSVTDFLAVVRASPDRDDSLVGCKYFATCSGCQLQMLPYEKQLDHKKRVIERAYAHFASMPAGVLPPVGPTIGSPMQYNYRTKLTPHFDGPRHGGFKPADLESPPTIGFNVKGRRVVLDIEDCPIAVPSVRAGIKEQREYVHKNLLTYKRGATILLRESTRRTPDDTDLSKFTEEKLYITDSNATSTEFIDEYKFTSPAGAFFQNNNSILPTFTAYIRENLTLPDAVAPPKYLVDAYCGSGLFTVTCGKSVQKAIGVDISADSIKFAERNAAANGITNASFIAGNAEMIFADIDFPGAETSCIIDPPRKGCDHQFLDQLLDFRPKRIIYVSCNVHTQARDMEYILKNERGRGYRVDSVRGFDFFPQTHHVESVAVLTWVE